MSADSNQAVPTHRGGRLRLVLSAATLLVLGAMGTLWGRTSERDAPTVDSPWPAHTTLTYDLNYTSEDSLPDEVNARVSSQGDSSLSLRGKLQFVVEDSGTVTLRLAECDELDWVLLGQRILEDDQPLLDGALRASLGPQGQLQALQVLEGTVPIAEHLLTALWRDIAFEVRPDQRYEAHEEDPRGETEADYERLDAHRLRRRRSRHQGSAEMSFASGVLENLTVEASEAADGGHHHRTLRLQRTSQGARVAGLHADAQWRPVSRERSRAEAVRRMLENRASNLTPESFAEHLDLYGDGGRMPQPQRFFWQATALLRLHPELLEDLEARIVAGDATPARRALLLDLLTHCGTPEAQQSLMAALDHPRLNDGGHVLLLQRAGLVSEPTEALLEWAHRRHQQAFDASDSSEDLRLASAYTLANAAAQRSRFTESDEAKAQASRLLAQRYEDAETPRARASMLGAYAIVADEDETAPFAEALDSEEPSLRRAAVRALGDRNTPEAQAGLRQALGDSHAQVQQVAIEHLSAAPPSLSALRTVLDGGALRPANFVPLARRLHRLQQESPDANGTLAHLARLAMTQCQDTEARSLLQRIAATTS